MLQLYLDLYLTLFIVTLKITFYVQYTIQNKKAKFENREVDEKFKSWILDFKYISVPMKQIGGRKEHSAQEEERLLA